MRLPSVGVMVHAVAAIWSRFFGSGYKDFAPTELRPFSVRHSPDSFSDVAGIVRNSAASSSKPVPKAFPLTHPIGSLV